MSSVFSSSPRFTSVTLAVAPHDQHKAQRHSGSFTAHADKDALKARVNLIDFAQAHGQEGRWEESHLKCHAPQREDRKPSFAVYPDHYYDYGTGESGDVFTYCQLIGLARDFREAVRYVAEWLGDPTALLQPAVQRPPFDPADPAPMPNPATQAFLQDFNAHSAESLWHDTPEALAVRTYLMDRGLTDDTIRAARLGYHRGSQRGQASQGKQPLPGVTIPWHTADGQIAAVRIRRRQGDLAHYLGIAEDEGSKYLSVTGSKPSAALYDATAAIGATVPADAPVLWTEGEFDALVAVQQLPSYQVVTRGSASAGCSAALAARFAGRPIFLCLDSDEAGQQGRAALVKRLSAANAQLFTVQLPDGVKDITQAVLAGHDLTALITQAVPVRSASADKTAPDPLASAPVASHRAPLSDKPPPVMIPAKLMLTSGIDTSSLGFGVDLYAPAANLPEHLTTFPDTWRAAANQYCPKQVAVVVEVYLELVRSGQIDETHGITVHELTTLAETSGRRTSESVIVRALRPVAQDSREHFFQELNTDLPADSQTYPSGKDVFNVSSG